MRRRLVPVVMFAALVLAGCGVTDEGATAGGDNSSDFCDRLEVFMDEADDDGDDDLTAEDVEAFRELAATAPAEIREEMDTLADVFDRLVGVEENSPEAMEMAFSVMFDPSFISAVEALESYGRDECGIEDMGMVASDDDTMTFDDSDGFSFDTEFDFGDGDFDDDGFDDDPFGGDGIPTLGVAEVEVTEAFERILGDAVRGNGRTRMGEFTVLDLYVTIDADQALDACEELSEFLAGHPDADGEAELNLHEDAASSSGEDSVLVSNESIAPGEPGKCVIL